MEAQSVSLGPGDRSLERARARRRSAGQRLAIVVGVHLAVVVFWQLSVVLFKVPAFILPSPIATLKTLASPSYAWPTNTLVSALEIGGGYLLGVLVGVTLALLFSWSRLFTLILLPLCVSLNMIPKVALGPLFIVWLSYGILPNILIAFSICFFPVLLTTARGLSEVPPDLLDLVRSLKGTRWQLFRKIQLPGALPYVFSGMKVGAVLAVAGAVVGEFIASERGLGYIMIQVQSSLDTPAMLMAVILLTMLGVLLYGAVLGIERLVIRDARV
jgi:NitT/TauT family transport system permease protein